MKLWTVLDTERCHTCKIGREHYPRDASTFDLIINEKKNTLRATVHITVHAASALDKTDQAASDSKPCKSLIDLPTIRTLITAQVGRSVMVRFRPSVSVSGITTVIAGDGSY